MFLSFSLTETFNKECNCRKLCTYNVTKNIRLLAKQQAAKLLLWERTNFTRILIIEKNIKIVYYAPREEKTWTIQISCKCTHEMWAGRFYSRGAYTIFPHTEVENDTFPFLRRARMGYFRPGVRKKV